MQFKKLLFIIMIVLVITVLTVEFNFSSMGGVVHFIFIIMLRIPITLLLYMLITPNKNSIIDKITGGMLTKKQPQETQN